MPPRLRDQYNGPVADRVKSEFGIANPMQMPRLQKIVVTVGLGRELEGTKLNATAKDTVIEDLALITGQKPIMKRAKKSVSNFKIRAGYEIGAMVTLRKAHMWEFLDRLVSLAIPRIKDFRGLSDRSFDGRGNYSFGVTEQGIFPEINMAEAKYTHGMNITMVFVNSSNELTRFVLGELGMPFIRPEEQAN